MDDTSLNILSGKIVDACIHVHRQLGPGLLESAYQACLEHVFLQRNILFEKEKTIGITFDDMQIDAGYRADFIVGNTVIIETKCVDRLAPIHEAQILTYMKLGNFPLGLLINFNERLVKDGIRRFKF